MTDIDKINGYLVDIFNQVVNVEEKLLQKGDFQDLSVKEIHTIEAIGDLDQPPSSKIADKLMVANSSMTMTINQLVRKGYVLRTKDEKDRRIVRLSLTQNGWKVYRLHRRFHRIMVKETLKGLEKEEIRVLYQGLQNLNQFLNDSWETLD